MLANSIAKHLVIIYIIRIKETINVNDKERTC